MIYPFQREIKLCIDRIEALCINQESPTKQEAYQCYHLLKNAIEKLKPEVRIQEFSNQEEEVQFFKGSYLEFITSFFFFELIVEHTVIEVGPTKRIKRFVAKIREQIRSSLFIKKPLVKYIEQNATHNDGLYYTRDSIEKYEIARIKASLQFDRYLESLTSDKIASEPSQPCKLGTSKSQLTLVIYLLKELNILAKESNTLSHIAKVVGRIFGINLSNLYETHSKISKSAKIDFKNKLEDFISNLD